MSTYRSNTYRMHSPGFSRRDACRGHFTPPEPEREIDWVQDGDDWIVIDIDTGDVFGRFATEGEALAVVDEFKWSGSLPPIVR